ncbi:15981_t:CDS:2 [Funneliformis mosseae]|uniref:15981_t:CDS:1 n=1 Tax=Funneliformis mosseae TaxID=27381 RepID=A0A9N9A355_FUNMO|nr:15981_t:CDS:2 [Funneliformis mosseae]
MTEIKTDILTILTLSYQECYDIIIDSLKNELPTLYSCINVNRSFCRIFIPILWSNPFKFIKTDQKLIQIFNTLIHCLDPSIKIKEIPTSKAYFDYHTLIKEFELNPLQKGLRLWTLKYLSKQNETFLISCDKKIRKKVVKINKYIGELFFSKRNQYEFINIYYNDLLFAPKSLLDVCGFKNHEESLIKVNKLSIGFFHKSNANLIPVITENFSKLQKILSPNIQHLQISIDTTRQHTKLSTNLINFIKSQLCLKSLIMGVFWNSLQNKSFLYALQKQSKSLTFLRLGCVDISYCSFIKEVQQQCHLNITHFHLIISRNYSFVDLIIILKNLRLIHLKINQTSSNRNYLSGCVHLYKEFSQAISPTLEILEVDFVVSDTFLETLLHETKINLQYIRLYRYEYRDTSLRIFYNYAKRKKCFRELGLSHILHFSTKRLRKAQKLFRVRECSDDEILSPFYDVPIANSYWSNRVTE